MSRRTQTVVLASALAGLFGTPLAAQNAPSNPRVLVSTTEGDFEIELFNDRAPATVVNFLRYVRDGYYDGTIFHRVIRDVMVQGGGFVTDGADGIAPKTEGLRGRIQNEATDTLPNRLGTIAMARLAEPHTARQQFFINLDDTPSFNHKNDTPQGFGYAVFGHVTDGMDVIRRIGNTRTERKGDYRDVPSEPIVIRSIRRVEVN